MLTTAPVISGNAAWSLIACGRDNLTVAVMSVAFTNPSITITSVGLNSNRRVVGFEATDERK